MGLFTSLVFGFMTIVVARYYLLWTKKRKLRDSFVDNTHRKEPRDYPHTDPNGQDLHQLTVEAYKSSRFLDFTEDLFKQYGPTFRTINSGKSWIKTKDPRLSKAVYATFFEKFGFQPIRFEGGQGFFGDGILVVDGPKWKHHRALIRPAFDVAHIANFDRLRRHVGKFMELIPKNGATVDLLPLFKRLTLDLSTEFIFGKCMNALSSPEKSADFIRAFTAAQRGVVMAASARDKNWQADCDIIHKYIDNSVEEAIARVSAITDDSDQSTRYLRIVDEMAKLTKGRRTLRYQVLSVTSPAHDTVAVTLSNLFFHLARHPRVWERLRKTIVPTANQPLTYQLLKSYKYLDWALRETHRLTPIAPASQRECLAPCTLPVGGGPDGQSPLAVTEGTVIETNFRLMYRDKDFWGADAEEFRPERWETIRPTWEFTPFSGGPRICPAVKLVGIECEYIAASIIREFSGLENRDKELRWVEERRLIFQSKNGALVGLVP